MKSETGEESKEANVDVLKEKPLTQVPDPPAFDYLLYRLRLYRF
jgi:hypothetical protein